ncbi:PhzF family phenazine biosynthesis protein [Angustibacter sp. McL0619]|uniref:PhzF family phenazine biosynthesis protein n=1 Tax=Angustibacter sp. McL0619 TaxID=3415676 RepID=UPI003CE6869F
MSLPWGPRQELEYAAFTDVPSGGNPAGVVPDAAGMTEQQMQAVAARLGHSETAFVTERQGRDVVLRYFSPLAEVAFCGHATVATGVVLGEALGVGPLLLRTAAGPVPVEVTRRDDGLLEAELTSVEPAVEQVARDAVDEALSALRWGRDDLHADVPPAIAFAGVRHLVLAARTRARLADLDYDFDELAALMRRLDLTTVQLVWRENATVLHVRDPFPVGGVVEDPATGAAALALGHYLRTLGLASPDAELTLRQGEDLGRPGVLRVRLVAGDPRVRVRGTAVPLRA